MSTERHLPFPVPDSRAYFFVGQYADMHQFVEDLVVPDELPAAPATVLRTARELLRHSYFCCEFSTVAALHSLIAVEMVLREKLPNAGTKPLKRLIQAGAASGLLTAEQAAMLDSGRQIRNRMAHGETTRTVMPPARALTLVRTSLTIVTALCAAPTST